MSYDQSSSNGPIFNGDVHGDVRSSVQIFTFDGKLGSEAITNSFD
jgi:hypothetical protein